MACVEITTGASGPPNPGCKYREQRLWIQLNARDIHCAQFGTTIANKANDEQDKPSMPEETSMRSDLVFDAMTYVSNRFLLTTLTAKATRKLHRPNTRIQETANDVFVRFSRTNPIARVQRMQQIPPQPLRKAS